MWTVWYMTIYSTLILSSRECFLYAKQRKVGNIALLCLCWHLGKSCNRQIFNGLEQSELRLKNVFMYSLFVWSGRSGNEEASFVHIINVLHCPYCASNSFLLFYFLFLLMTCHSSCVLGCSLFRCLLI